MISNDIKNKSYAEPTKARFLSIRDMLWVFGLATVGTFINYLPYNGTVALLFQVVFATIIIISSIKRPVMMIVAYIFLAIFPTQLVGGFIQETGDFYYLSRFVLCLMAVAFWFLNTILVRGEEKHSGKFNYWLVAFGVFGLLSYLWTISNVYYDFGFWWLCIAYILFPYFIASEKDLRLVLFSYFVYIQLFGISILPILLSGNLYRGIVNLDPNYASFSIVLGMICALVLFTMYRNILSKPLKLSLIAGIVFNVIVLSIFASRTAFLALAVLLVLYMLINATKILTVIITAALSIVSYLILSTQGFFDNIFLRLADVDVMSGGGRVRIWELILTSFSNSDIFRKIFGNGYLTTGFFGRGVQAHNTYISILIGFGFIGMFLFLAYQIGTFKIIITRRITPYLLFAICLLIYCFSLEPYLIPDGIVFFALLGALGNVKSEKQTLLNEVVE